MIRALILLILLPGLAWWLYGEQQRGRFREVDDAFLDFLLANTRQELKPEPERLKDVVFLRMREEDKKEYAAWPPKPIDYQMIVKGLAPYEPSTLIIAEPLSWPEPKPEFVDQLAQTLLPLPAVVLAAGAAEGSKPEASATTFAADHLPEADVRGTADSLPQVAAFDRIPEASLLRQSDLGCLLPAKPASAMRLGMRTLPSLEWIAIANASRTPLRLQHLNLGPGAGLHVADELFIPLEPDGSFPKTSLQAPSINALDLMTAALTDPDPELEKTLGKGRTLVLGIDHDGGDATVARRCAQAVATALALPRVQVLAFVPQVIAWGVAALVGLSLLLLPKSKGLTRALVYLVLALTGSYLAFQSLKIWCPPAIPAALILAGGLYARLFGRHAMTTGAAPVAIPAPPAEGQ